MKLRPKSISESGTFYHSGTLTEERLFLRNAAKVLAPQFTAVVKASEVCRATATSQDVGQGNWSKAIDS